MLFVRCFVVIVVVCSSRFAVVYGLYFPMLVFECAIIIYCQWRKGLITLVLCHIVFDGIVFIAPLHLFFDDVHYSLSDLFDFIFRYRVVVFCSCDSCDLLLKCVDLDFLCLPWSM